MMRIGPFVHRSRHVPACCGLKSLQSGSEAPGFGSPASGARIEGAEPDPGARALARRNRELDRQAAEPAPKLANSLGGLRRPPGRLGVASARCESGSPMCGASLMSRGSRSVRRGARSGGAVPAPDGAEPDPGTRSPLPPGRLGLNTFASKSVAPLEPARSWRAAAVPGRAALLLTFRPGCDGICTDLVLFNPVRGQGT